MTVDISDLSLIDGLQKSHLNHRIRITDKEFDPLFSDTLEDYLQNPEKYVYPFTVQINGKKRELLTYSRDENGLRLRWIHEAVFRYLEKGL